MSTEVEEYILETSSVISDDGATIDLWAEVQFDDFRIATSGRVAVDISTGDVEICDSALEQWLDRHPNSYAELMEIAKDLRSDELEYAEGAEK